MKFYIYVSDTKVDMLYSQIPRGLKTKIAAEIKIGFEFFSVVFKGKESKETSYSKLDQIVAYIKKNFDVGTVDNPKSYFEGILPMHWGPYKCKIDSHHGSDPGIVYFGGSTDSTTLGLCGSQKHLIRNPKHPVRNGGDSSSHSGSFAYYLLSVLAEEFQLPLYCDYEERSSIEERKLNSLALDAVCLATSRMGGPKQQLEFLAKTLLFGPSHLFPCSSVLLGTPIYVALAD